MRWEEITELVLEKREERREGGEAVYNFFGRLGAGCVVKLKDGDKEESIEREEMLYMRAVGGVKRTFPFVDLSGFGFVFFFFYSFY